MTYTHVATYNVGAGKTAQKVSHLTRLSRSFGVTVIGLQEASDRSAMIAIFKNVDKSWRSYRSLLPGGSAVPILWDNAEWKRIRFRSPLALAKQWVGPKGAGPTFNKDKRVTIVVLQNRKTGLRVKFLNTHFIPSANRQDLSAREERVRHDAYVKHAVRVRKIVQRTKIPVVLTMDANSPGTSRLTAPMHQAKLRGWTCVPTHGKNIFDHVLSRDLVRAGEQTVSGASDHKTVVAKFRTDTTTKENPR